MLLKDINPFIRQFITGHLTKSITYDVSNMLQTFDHRLFYIISGYGEMLIDDYVFPLHPGTAILFKSGTEYMWMIDEIKYYCINFDYTQTSSHITKGFHPVHSHSFNKNSVFEQVSFEDAPLLDKPIIIDGAQTVENQMKLIASEYYIGSEYSPLLLSSLLKSLILTMLSMANKRQTPQQSKESLLVQNIIEYLNTNYSKNISNSILGDFFHFHPAYINRIFKKYAGTTMHEFLINRRLSAAMEILRSQNISVHEVARITGFSDTPYFTRIFKKRIGITPSEYKKTTL